MRRWLFCVCCVWWLGACAGPAVEVTEAPPPAITLLAGMLSTPLPPTATIGEYVLLPSGTPLPTDTPVPTRVPPSAGLDSTENPLTGLQVEEAQLLERRPIAVKITNFPRSVRPQWGLSSADQVYEYYLEDDLTRFIGIFYGRQAARVGPVRSGRFFDQHIVQMYRSIFVFGYADDDVIGEWLKADFSGRLVIEHPDNCPPLCRIGPKEAYNTLFLNTAQLGPYLQHQGVENRRPELYGFNFDPFPPDGSPAEQLRIRFSAISYHRWDYDASGKRYLRFQEVQDLQGEEEGAYEALVDRATGEQLGAENIVVLLIPHEYYRHSSSTDMFKINFLGEGRAYGFRDGEAYELKWRRQQAEQFVALEHLDGEPYLLKPGVTWFEVLGETSALQQTPEHTWRFTFNIP